MMAQSKTLTYFNPNAETTGTVDASPYGLDAVLSQSVGGCERVVAYGHRSLSAVERRDSQTEREVLAIVWGCEHFTIYLIGTKFRLVTDQKPLEFIFNCVNSKRSAKIERWVHRLQAFDYEVVYKPGSMNIADPLSRLSVDEQTTYKVNNVADEYVMMIAKLSVPMAINFNESKNAAAKCLEMGHVGKSLINGNRRKHFYFTQFPNNPGQK